MNINFYLNNNFSHTPDTMLRMNEGDADEITYLFRNLQDTTKRLVIQYRYLHNITIPLDTVVTFESLEHEYHSELISDNEHKNDIIESQIYFSNINGNRWIVMKHILDLKPYFGRNYGGGQLSTLIQGIGMIKIIYDDMNYSIPDSNLTNKMMDSIFSSVIIKKNL